MRPASDRPLALLIPLALLACAGCEGDPGGETGTGPRLEFEVAHLDLGTVMAGEHTSAELSLSNTGDRALIIGDLTVIGPSVFFVDRPEEALALPPGDSRSLTVTFEPRTDSSYDAVLVIDSNETANPSIGVSLAGMGVAPEILLSPPTLDFGELEVGCTAEVEVLIRNVGSLPLVIEELLFQPTSGELQMHSSPTPGTLLESQQTATVVLRYAPQDEIPDASYLHVVSNDPWTPDALATQTGSGRWGDVVVDEFDQVQLATDILWAVDTSCSMGDEQSVLLQNFASFIDIVELLGLDYRAAAISTQSSYFHGATPIITPDTPDTEAAFLDAVSFETSGTHGQAMEMAAQALTPPESSPGGPNHGFLREYAALHIVFISDQDDFSPDSVAEQVAQLQSLKLSPDWVTLHGVTGQWTGCNGPGGNAGASPRYEQAIAMTGGTSASLCDEEWIHSLFDADVMSSEVDSLELSQEPVVSTIEVQVNGVPAYSGWLYDPWRHVVTFEPGCGPNAGDRVTITYRRLGSC